MSTASATLTSSSRCCSPRPGYFRHRPSAAMRTGAPSTGSHGRSLSLIAIKPTLISTITSLLSWLRAAEVQSAAFHRLHAVEFKSLGTSGKKGSANGLPQHHCRNHLLRTALLTCKTNLLPDSSSRPNETAHYALHNTHFQSCHPHRT
jgi:hypothetical protein